MCGPPEAGSHPGGWGQCCHLCPLPGGRGWDEQAAVWTPCLPPPGNRQQLETEKKRRETVEREKEQMMREKEELMLRLQDYEEKTRKAEKGGRGLLGGGALVQL